MVSTSTGRSSSLPVHHPNPSTWETTKCSNAEAEEGHTNPSNDGPEKPTDSTSHRHAEAAYDYKQMPCFHPLPAWRTKSGEIILHKEQPDSIHLRLPCGGCLGCRSNRAQAWALRCQLETQRHTSTVFTTLTYDDEHLPLTLQERDVQLWLKRLRKHTNTQQAIRYFYSGEYGERTQRPHYHAILYGLSQAHGGLVESTWGHGHTRTEPITPARIAYTAGYCQKKIDYKHNTHERVDPLTGEVYIWQPPYIQMSKGIGGDARKWAQSWRLYAVKDGHKMPVPRYLHEAWKAQATVQQQEDLLYEKSLLPHTDTSPERLQAAEKIMQKQQQLTAERRKYEK